MADIYVSAGQSLQAALNAAASGDTVLLERGATFEGNVFPGPASDVVVRTDGELPTHRAGPADAGPMAKLASGNNDPVLFAGGGVTDWAFRYLQFIPGIQEGIVCDGAHDMRFDQILMVAGANGGKRGIRGNGQDINLTRSHLANFWSTSQDAQAFCAWDGAGPYLLDDNYLEASGENVMFGGANSQSPEHIPSDITVTRNLMLKPEEWRGTNKVIKNLFELKSARRVRVIENHFEGNWGGQGQPGYAIVFTVRNDEGGSPWSCIDDVLFENNVVIGERGLNIYGCNDGSPSGFLDRVIVRKSLFVTEQVGFQIGGEAQRVTFDHVSFINGADRLGTLYRGRVWPIFEPTYREATCAVRDLMMHHCLGSHRTYGIFADGNGQGMSALADMCEQYYWLNNAVAEPGGIVYPPDTLSLSQAEHDAQFTTAEYLLVPSSIYRNHGGTDLGWTGGAATPDPTPEPVATMVSLAFEFEGRRYTVRMPGTVSAEELS